MPAGRILVTGATGYIGRHCLAGLVAGHDEVHAVTHRKALPFNGVQFHTADLLNLSATRSLIEKIKPSTLLHLAWYAVPDKYWHAPDNVAWQDASVGLFSTFAAAGGKRAVFAGTCAEYEHTSALCSERDTAIRPSSLYGISKDNVRTAVERLATNSGCGVAWARIFYSYGPHEAAPRLVPSVIKHLLTRQPLRCTDGEDVRDYLHVQDVADACIALLSADVVGPVNIASGVPVAIKTVIGTIARALQSEDLIQWGALPHRDSDPQRVVADVGRLRQEVGWQPRIELETGLRATIDWWRRRERDE